MPSGGLSGGPGGGPGGGLGGGLGGGRRLGLAIVRGRSMEPTLREGDRLLVVHHGRVAPGRLCVVRLPDGTVAVKRAVRRESDGWWVERDNPTAGVDSWSVGTIPDVDVVARVLARVWPLRRPEPVEH